MDKQNGMTRAIVGVELLCSEKMNDFRDSSQPTHAQVNSELVTHSPSSYLVPFHVNRHDVLRNLMIMFFHMEEKKQSNNNNNNLRLVDYRHTTQSNTTNSHHAGWDTQHPPCTAVLYTEGLSGKRQATNGAQRLMNRTWLNLVSTTWWPYLYFDNWYKTVFTQTFWNDVGMVFKCKRNHTLHTIDLTAIFSGELMFSETFSW